VRCLVTATVRPEFSRVRPAGVGQKRRAERYAGSVSGTPLRLCVVIK
jgi:hypothetical protein